ncbi:PIN domain protein [Medicago truncatula]|uniref:PIN domain protein n=1 Tax=Medicago truncatula TaxID=3880 RepID=A0A072UB29_MEDTR|nr:PIN domain protein [Medicago truncatula]
MLPAMNSVVGRKKKKIAKGDLASEITCTPNKIKQIPLKHVPENCRYTVSLLHQIQDRFVREHYLRDDIYCGAPSCTICNTYGARLGASPSTMLVLDTNVVLNQIDLLENPAIDDVVVLSIVLDEVKNKNLSVYLERGASLLRLREYRVIIVQVNKDCKVQDLRGYLKHHSGNSHKIVRSGLAHVG